MSFLSRKQIREGFTPDRTHAEIDEELQFHIESKTEELIGRGVEPADAREAARKQFGSVARLREDSFEVRGQNWLEELAGDMQYALRLLRKRPSKTLVLIATLALGIGANTAVYGVIRSVLLNPLPFPKPDQLVVLRQSEHGKHSGVSYPHFQDWRERSHSFAGISVFLATTATLTEGVQPMRVSGAIVSASLFPVLGVKPLRGRVFLPEEDRRGGSSSVLISDRLWRTRLGERGNILGQTIRLDGRPFQIVGILPASQAFPMTKDPVDYWVTVAVDADPALYGGTIPTSRGYFRYEGAIARLSPGVTLAGASAEMTTIAAGIARQYPGATSANEVQLISALEEIVGPSSRTMLALLYGAVFCVLLVACVNIANIQLADAVSRRREFALRTALGAPLNRLVRQVIAENTTLALLGGAASIGVSFMLMRLFVVFAPPDTARLPEIGFDVTVVFYVLAVSLLSGLLLGCLPAMETRKRDLVTPLKEGAPATVRSRWGLRSGPVLLCCQIAIGMVLTCSALHLASSFYQILHSPRGFNPHDVVTAQVTLPPSAYGQQSDRVRNYYRALLEQVRELPGVEVASIAEALPLSGDSNGTTVKVAGSTEAGLPGTGIRFIDPQYFRTLQMAVRSGRSFTEEDRRNRSAVVIVNEAFTRRFLRGKDPFTTNIRLGWGGDGWKQIVGVVTDIRPTATSPNTDPEVYVPFAQFSPNDMAILIRTASDPETLAPTLTSIARKLDPQVPLDRIRTLDEYRLISAAPNRFLMWLLAGFAGLTLLLAAIGIYGVLGNRIAARTKEFGIRLALGSSRRRITGLVLREGLLLGCLGLVAGSVLSVYSGRLLAQWMYQGTPVQILLFAGSAALLLLVVVAASTIPSRRASQVDPAKALRTA